MRCDHLLGFILVLAANRANVVALIFFFDFAKLAIFVQYVPQRFQDGSSDYFRVFVGVTI